MTETTTPTDEVVDQSSSDSGDASLLDDNNEQDSAVERQNDTDSGEQDSQDSDSDDSSSQDDSSNEDKGLAKFAKSQGIEDLSELSAREKSLLKTAHDNIREKRKSMKDDADQRKLSDEIEDMSKPKEGDDANAILLKRMANLEAENKSNKFWTDHSEDRKYEGKMAELLLEEKKTFGEDAAWRLAQNLPRLLREAKFATGDNDSDVARDAGRREERERLRKEQEGSADGAHASQSVSKGKTKINADWVENTYDPSNEEHRKMLDAAIARGDLY